MKYANKKSESYYTRKLRNLVRELNTVYDAESQEALIRKINKLTKFIKEKYGKIIKIEKGEW